MSRSHRRYASAIRLAEPLPIIRRLPCRLALAGVMIFAEASVSHAQTAASWTAAGSIGVVDEADASVVEFGQTGGGISVLHEAAFVKTSAPAPVEATLRYNVLAVDGLLSGGPHWALKARLRDAGSAVVFARLIRVNISNGTTTELLTLQSNLFPKAAGFRRLSTTQPMCSDAGFNFDFQKNIYFVQVTLAKNSSDGEPAIAALQIIPTACR